MLWINFLHFYQPANIEREKIIEAAEKSYSKILTLLEKNPGIKFSINLSGSLLIRFTEELKYDSLIGRLANLIAKGQVEIVGTAAYHPLIPLTNSKIVLTQIKEQEELLKKYLTPKKPLGFFLPEMAYSAEAGKQIKKLGYEWIVLDEISSGLGQLGKIDTSKIYQDQKSGLKIIFRSRHWSSGYIPKNTLENWESLQGKTIITGTDAELYGLKHEDHSGSFSKLLEKDGLRTATISEFIDSSDAPPEPVDLLPSSWETTEKEMEEGVPFALWSGNDKIHKKLWKLARLAEKLYLKHKKSEANLDEPRRAGYWAYWHLVRGLASCTFWWASGKSFDHNFGPRAWSPDETEKGINELVRSIRSLEKCTDLKTKLRAEKLALEIKKLVWEKHWKEQT